MLKESIQKLKDIVASIDGDAAKALTGNKAAAVRLGKLAQEAKDAAQRIRTDALALSYDLPATWRQVQGRAVGGPGVRCFGFPKGSDLVDGD